MDPFRINFTNQLSYSANQANSMLAGNNLLNGYRPLGATRALPKWLTSWQTKTLQPQLLTSKLQKEKVIIRSLCEYSPQLRRYELLACRHTPNGKEKNNDWHYDYFFKLGNDQELPIFAGLFPKDKDPLDLLNAFVRIEDLYATSCANKILQMMLLVCIDNDEYEYIPFGRYFDFGNQAYSKELIRELWPLSRLHCLLIRHRATQEEFISVHGLYIPTELTFNQAIDLHNLDPDSHILQLVGKINDYSRQIAAHNSAFENLIRPKDTVLYYPKAEEWTKVNDNEHKLQVLSNQYKLIMLPVKSANSTARLTAFSVQAAAFKNQTYANEFEKIIRSEAAQALAFFQKDDNKLNQVQLTSEPLLKNEEDPRDKKVTS